MSGGGASCSTFCGYHGHFNYGGLDIQYAVFPHLDCNACKVSGLTVADMIDDRREPRNTRGSHRPDVERVA